MTTSDSSAPRAQVGSQTLARGITALLSVVESPDGMTVQRLAQELDIHRSIAYRILQTLRDFGLVAYGDDGVYRAGSRLAGLSTAYLPTLRKVAAPAMRRVADLIGCTVSLFVAEGDEAVSIDLVEPMTVNHHIAFRAGMRTPITRGAAGYALLASAPATADEPEAVTVARERGYATSSGEVEAGAFAAAAPIPNLYPAASLAIMSYREDQVHEALEHLVAAANEIGRAVVQSG